MHRIRFEPRAQRELRKLPAAMRERVTRAVEALASDPRPPGYLKLHDPRAPLYRIRVANCRVIYEIRDRELIVLIVRVALRNERSYHDL